MSGEDLSGVLDPATPPAPAASDSQQGAAPSDVTPSSSPADVTADSSPATDVTPASSPADGVDRQSLLDVTRAALGVQKPGDPDSPSKNGQDNGQPGSDPTATPPTAAKTDANSDDLSPDADDDFADADKLDFGKHPRFKRLLSQWRRDRGEASSHRQVQSFLHEHGVTQETAAQALKLAALQTHALRGSAEHAKLFLADLVPMVTQLRQLVGEEIAPDLQERVSAGAIDEPTARELTQSRQQSAAAKIRDEEVAQERDASQRNELRNEITKAVSVWDAGVRTRDPDFSRKEKLVTSTIQAIASREGLPRTPKEAVALADRAYKEVSESFAGLTPPPPPPPKKPTSSAASSVPRSTVRPKPMTPIEITKMALARTRTAS